MNCMGKFSIFITIMFSCTFCEEFTNYIKRLEYLANEERLECERNGVYDPYYWKLCGAADAFSVVLDSAEFYSDN